MIISRLMTVFQWLIVVPILAIVAQYYGGFVVIIIVMYSTVVRLARMDRIQRRMLCLTKFIHLKYKPLCIQDPSSLAGEIYVDNCTRRLQTPCHHHWFCAYVTVTS